MARTLQGEKRFVFLDEKIIALIPARGGSKGVKKKNIRNLVDKPLIAYTIEAAQKSKYLDKVIVSTDCKEIAEVSMKYGAEVPFLRPAELAQDTTPTLDVVLHFIDFVNEYEKWNTLVLLQPTQPLRTAEDIDNAIEQFYYMGKRSLVSVSEVNDHPILMRNMDQQGVVHKLLKKTSSIRRQDMEKVYRVNGAIYINDISEITTETSFNDNEIGFKMEKSHSIDIDEMVDFSIAEYYLERDR